MKIDTRKQESHSVHASYNGIEVHVTVANGEVTDAIVSLPGTSSHTKAEVVRIDPMLFTDLVTVMTAALGALNENLEG